MTLSQGRHDPNHRESTVAEAAIVDPVSENPAPSQEPSAGSVGTAHGRAAPSTGAKQAGEFQAGDVKTKVLAMFSGAAALANKACHQAPQKVRKARQKRAARRCIILTQRRDHIVAIGPYRNEEEARADTPKIVGAPRIIPLVSHKAYFTPDTYESASLP